MRLLSVKKIVQVQAYGIYFTHPVFKIECKYLDKKNLKSQAECRRSIW